MDIESEYPNKYPAIDDEPDNVYSWVSYQAKRDEKN